MDYSPRDGVYNGGGGVTSGLDPRPDLLHAITTGISFIIKGVKMRQ